MRLVEVRMLEGPNLYRLDPVVKIEVELPGDEGVAPGRLDADVPPGDRPPALGPLVDWLGRLRAEFGEASATSGGVEDVTVHRASDPGHWIVAAPWTGHERAHSIAEAAVELAIAAPDTREALLAAHEARIREARATPPAMLTDAARRMPIISISGTNGKSTVTRLITHVLLLAGRHVGTTTSDGVLVDERMIEPGDWTGPGGAGMILGRGDVEVAVLETARGGILLRGVAYQSNDASVLTNVTSDHLHLQGIHTLPQLAEVKSIIARITRPDGWVVLNADDPLVAAVARDVRAKVAFFSLAPSSEEAPPVLQQHLAAGGRAYLVRSGQFVEMDGGRATSIVEVATIPITLGGIARHNVANALAAAGGARAMGATIAEVASGLQDFKPTMERSPGRLNLFRLGRRTIIVDYAHNEAGIAAVMDVAEGIAAGGAGRAAPITAIIGAAGDRPDDALEGIGRIAATHAQRVAIKELLHYLRGRERESVVSHILAGIRSAGYSPDVPVYETETEALRTELALAAAPGETAGARRVIVMTSHEERREVFELLAELGARPIDVATELADLVPRLQPRPHTT